MLAACAQKTARRQQLHEEAFAGARVLESETPGVQQNLPICLTPDRGATVRLALRIDKIAQERGPDRGKVRANLMEPASLDSAFQQRDTRAPAGAQTVVGHRGAALRIRPRNLAVL